MVNGPNVNCELVWREVSNYLEGEVDAGLRTAMDEHFRTCARCRSVLEGTRNVIRLYSDERMIEVPAGFGRRLEKRLAQSTPPGRSRWSSWSAWMIPAAALVLIAGTLRLASSMTTSPPLKTEHAQPGINIPLDMKVIVTADTKVFHVAGCPFIHNISSAKTLTAREAIAQGYAPCLRCMRKYLNTAAVHSAPDLEINADDDGPEEVHTGGQ